jgi:transposase
VVRGKGIGRHVDKKTVVMGMVEKGGEVATQVVPDVKRDTLWPIIQANVMPSSTIHTDELRSYRGFQLRGYRHMTVNHNQGEYVSRYGCSTNTLESFWSQLKRGIAGTHIHVSPKHLPKYLAEFEYRWNMRAVPHLMLDRLMFSFVR